MNDKIPEEAKVIAHFVRGFSLLCELGPLGQYRVLAWLRCAIAQDEVIRDDDV